MQQFSIKNDEAVRLLDNITALTGKGKTEVIIEALQQYRKKLSSDSESKQLIDFFEREIHPFVKAEYLGKAPSKKEIEEELGMP